MDIKVLSLSLTLKKKTIDQSLISRLWASQVLEYKICVATGSALARFVQIEEY